MRTKLLSVTLFVMLTAVSTAFAQGDYVERGRGGVQAGGGARLNSDINVFEAGFSSNFFDYFELGLAFGASLDSDNPSVSYLKPSLVLYPTKYEKVNLPVSFAFEFTHTEYDYSYDDGSITDIDSYTRSAGGFLYRNFRLTPTADMQLRAGYAYKWGYFGNHRTVGRDIDEWVGSGGLSVFKAVNERTVLRFDIGLENEDSETTVYFRAGLLRIFSGGA